MLSAIEVDALARGRMLKRVVRAAAALNDVFDDVTLADRVSRNRGAVGHWWRGSRPDPGAILSLADATGLSSDELTRFLYSDGPPPTLPPISGVALESIADEIAQETLDEGLARDPARDNEAAPPRAPSQRRLPHARRAGSGQ